MRILPVLDVMNGQVVRGVGGRRADYRPLVSRLTDSTNPVDVANALQAHFGLKELYLADLDAIMRRPPGLELIRSLHAAGFRLWVDAGLREAADARPLAAAGVATIVAGLETSRGPEMLGNLCHEYGSDRIVFSLDLKAGQSLGAHEDWPCADPKEIAHLVIAAGVQRFLVLDLARIGTGSGTGTEGLCRYLAQTYPQIRLASGGGVATMADIERLEAGGVETVLIASALHDGRITPGANRRLDGSDIE
jgi:phosphoribosylformimino-5-aminoimidazole carboxamide ribotide isomerase